MSGDDWLAGVYSNTSTIFDPGTVAGASYATTGKKFCNGNDTNGYSPRVQQDDWLSVILDMDAKTIEFAINGISQGVACEGLPDTVYIGVSLNNNTEVVANFGNSPWLYPELTQ